MRLVRDPAIVTKLIGQRGTNITKDDQILAIGTGNSVLTFTIEQYAANVTLIYDEAQSAQVELIRKKHPNLKLVRADSPDDITVLPTGTYKVFIFEEPSIAYFWNQYFSQFVTNSPVEIYAILPMASINRFFGVEDRVHPDAIQSHIKYSQEIISTVFLPSKKTSIPFCCIKLTLRPEPLLEISEIEEFQRYVNAHRGDTSVFQTPSRAKPEEWIEAYKERRGEGSPDLVTQTELDTTTVALEGAASTKQLNQEIRTIRGKGSIDEQLQNMKRVPGGYQVLPELILTIHSIDRVKDRIGTYTDLAARFKAVLKNKQFASSEIQKPSGNTVKRIDYRGIIYIFNEDFSKLITTYPSNATKTGQSKMWNFLERREKSKKRHNLEAYDRHKTRRQFDEELDDEY